MPRRLKWGTTQYLEQLVAEYFESHSIPTIAGLCLALGIRSDTWKYYICEGWRSKYGAVEYEKFRDERDENNIFQDLIEISPNTYVFENGSQSVDDDAVKAAVSSIFQMAKQKIDAFVSEEIFKSKNPAGPIYYSKAALGYRENDLEAANSNQKLPGAINIIIMPQPEKPKQIGDCVIEQLPSTNNP